MNRRLFLQSGLGAAVCGGEVLATGRFSVSRSGGGCGEHYGPQPPAFSIIPVVGDGTWIWTKPPVGQTGFLEPRAFDASVGIEITGTDNARSITATTPVPIELPEQKIDDVRIETQGGLARLRALTPTAAQFMLAAHGIFRGQTIRALAHFRLTLHKEYFGYEKDQFPEQHKTLRLVNDWAQWMGSRPKTRFLAELKPVPPASNADAGPGARSKDENGQWLVVGNHPVDKIARR